ASCKSAGMARKKLRMIRTPNGRPNATCGRMMPQRESTRPRWRISRESGRMGMAAGERETRGKEGEDNSRPREEKRGEDERRGACESEHQECRRHHHKQTVGALAPERAGTKDIRVVRPDEWFGDREGSGEELGVGLETALDRQHDRDENDQRGEDADGI